MLFEPFIMYSYSLLSPERIHSIWGEFKAGDQGPLRNRQMYALGKTLESMRRDFASCLLLVSGSLPSALLKNSHLRLESRFGVGEHNGRIEQYPGPYLGFIAESGAEPVDYVGLTSPGVSFAALLSAKPPSLQAIKDMVAQATGPGRLRADLLDLIKVYIGFDHDAFFTLETKNAELVREALRSADVWQNQSR